MSLKFLYILWPLLGLVENYTLYRYLNGPTEIMFVEKKKIPNAKKVVLARTVHWNRFFFRSLKVSKPPISAYTLSLMSKVMLYYVFFCSGTYGE